MAFVARQTSGSRASAPGCRAGGAQTAPPEDGLSHRDFQRIAAAVTGRTGIRLPPAKRGMVESRLRRHVRDRGLPSLKAYSRRLFDEGGLEAELPGLIDTLTTNKTDFFREPAHYDLLSRRLVPELLDARRGGAGPRLKLWSAACSTGAELWSAAMVLGELADGPRPFEFALLGTDISTRVLEIARLAVYPAEQLDPAPEALRRRWLLRGRAPKTADRLRVAPELRRRARFDRLNLMDRDWPVDRDVDLIFLRNVLIYFEPADQAAVTARCLRHLRPGGFLLLGHSEAMIGGRDAVDQVAPSVFRKR